MKRKSAKKKTQQEQTTLGLQEPPINKFLFWRNKLNSWLSVQSFKLRHIPTTLIISAGLIFAMFAVQIYYIVVFKERLPSQIPIFMFQPEDVNKLANSQLILIFPVTTMLFLILGLAGFFTLSRYQNSQLKLYIVWLSLITVSGLTASLVRLFIYTF